VDPVTKEVTKNMVDRDVPVSGEYIYSLRYEEFIAPVIKTEQYLMKEVEKLNTEVASLKSTIQSLVKDMATIKAGNSTIQSIKLGGNII
ncbi:MAG: hypothetical protein RSF70_05465, partial [Ruthenibacterium sp.]